jgi:excisionase family DNA binding protein
MPWLTKKEAAEYLSVCESTIDNMESAGRLRGHRAYLGSKRPILRFRQEDLDNLFLGKPKGRPRQTEVTQRFDSVCPERSRRAHHMPNL